MQRRQSGGYDRENLPHGLRRPIEGYLTDKGKGVGGDSGTYRRNADRVITTFAGWLVEYQDVESLEDLEVRHLRVYARDELPWKLGDPEDSKRAKSTIHKSYDYISAWLGWCEREGVIPEHYGTKHRARESLPDLDQEKKERQQTWRPEHRRALLQHVDRVAHEAVDDRGHDAMQETRDRALVYLLAFSGVRVSEIVANRADDRRNGIGWEHLSDSLKKLDVLSKKQEWDDRAIPSSAHPAIRRWRSVLDPEPEWPLFPTFHLPTQYAALEGVASEEQLEEVTGLQEVLKLFREFGERPVSITDDGARSILSRLTEEAGIVVDGDEEEYLKPHGARRGLGLAIVEEQGADAAADQLDNSVRVVEEAYSDVLTEDRADETDEAVNDYDARE